MPSVQEGDLMKFLAIDPGNLRSAFVVIDTDTCRPVWFGKELNTDLIHRIRSGDFEDCDGAAIEMIASYGMPVGIEVFETCTWIGRFTEAMRLIKDAPPEPVLIPRQPIKIHFCHSSKAKDSNVIRALVDRFAPGEPNYGKGSKIDPGWFYGFNADVWQAYALAVYAADTRSGVL
jgi:hypothetical protein